MPAALDGLEREPVILYDRPGDVAAQHPVLPVLDNVAPEAVDPALSPNKGHRGVGVATDNLKTRNL